MDLNNWINNKLIEISQKLPDQVHVNPASFACGYNMGYKQALLDFQNFIEQRKIKN